MPSTTNPKQFWEKKILTWEQDRYEDGKTSSVLEFFAHRASYSLLRRAELAKEILGAHVRGMNVLELGCGSGKLSEDLIRAGAKSYTGIDIAGPAIENAKQIAAEKGISDVVKFEESDLQSLGDYDVDIVFSLGLTDWLTDDEIRLLFSRFKGAAFLHSISEKRPSLAQTLHRFYCYVAYGYKTKGYVPRYFLASQIANAARQFGADKVYLLRDARMKFGTFVTTFPVAGSVPIDVPTLD
jgi:SAM-dependent methyltransferase